MKDPHVTRVEVDGVAVIAPVGEFDVSSAEILRSSLLDGVEQQARVALDLSGTTFLDSLALGAIIGAGKKARAAGGWIRLVAPTAYVRRVLRVTEVDTVLGLYDSVEEAIAHDDQEPTQ